LIGPGWVQKLSKMCSDVRTWLLDVRAASQRVDW